MSVWDVIAVSLSVGASTAVLTVSIMEFLSKRCSRKTLRLPDEFLYFDRLANEQKQRLEAAIKLLEEIKEKNDAMRLRR